MAKEPRMAKRCSAVLALCLVLVACEEDTAPEIEEFVYSVGILSSPTTDNFWAMMDFEDTPWNHYLLDGTKPSLYTYRLPGMVFANDVAAFPDPPIFTQEGELWTVNVPIRSDVVWSDGSPITAADVAFTFQTVKDLGLRGGWRKAYPTAGPVHLVAVQEVDAHTVKFVFNQKPGLVLWPNTVGLAPIMPRSFWAERVNAALSTEDPRQALYAESGVGDLSGGPVVFDSIGSDGTARILPNGNYYWEQEQVLVGDVLVDIGPHFEAMEFRLYESRDAALTGLHSGEIQYLMDPDGIDRTTRDALIADPDFTVVENASNNFTFLAFNLRKNPTGLKAFRDAVALVIDKEFLAEEVFQGLVTPLYTSIPHGNTMWFNSEIVSGFAAEYTETSTAMRFSEAVAILEEAGFSWDQPPIFLDDTVQGGSGIRYQGEPVPPLTILAPGQSYDPIRATYSIWIETWLNQLGFRAEAQPIDFDTLIQTVFVPDAEHRLDFDMFILGVADLGNPFFPNHHEAFWAGYNDTLLNEGNNAPGFHNQEFDLLLGAYNTALSMEEASGLLWDLEEILFNEKPFIFLYEAKITEAYRSSDIFFPTTSILGGIQSVGGIPELVKPPS